MLEVPTITPGKRPTLKDVAQHAGVSRATASLVLRRSPLVAERTRRRVLQSMEAIGYVYNRSAASLRQRSSQAIAMVVPDLRNPYYAALALDVEGRIEQESYVLFLCSTEESPARQRRMIESMQEYGVDGIILSPAALTTVDDLADLVAGPTPVVLATRRVAGVRADYVGFDNEKGAEVAVTHLIDRGHRRIGFMAGQAASSAGQERMAGYRRALEAAHIEYDRTLVISHPITTLASYEGIQRLMTVANPPTAVFCFNDFVAHGVLFGLWESGATPGSDVAVVGYDNLEESAYWRPPLTTVDHPRDVIGSEAARLLFERIEKRDLTARTMLYEPTLMVRESCGTRRSRPPWVRGPRRRTGNSTRRDR